MCCALLCAASIYGQSGCCKSARKRRVGAQKRLSKADKVDYVAQGDLIRKSGVERHLLRAAQDCLLWAYKKFEQPTRCQLEFWEWAVGLHVWQLQNPPTPEAK